MVLVTQFLLHKHTKHKTYSSIVFLKRQQRQNLLSHRSAGSNAVLN
jgi:hypothetical protein